MVIYDQLAGGREIFLASAMPTVRSEKKNIANTKQKKLHWMVLLFAF